MCIEDDFGAENEAADDALTFCLWLFIQALWCVKNCNPKLPLRPSPAHLSDKGKMRRRGRSGRKGRADLPRFIEIAGQVMAYSFHKWLVWYVFLLFTSAESIRPIKY